MNNKSEHIINAVLGDTFLLTRDKIIDTRLKNDTKLRGYILSQKYTYFDLNFEHQGKFPRCWNSWEEVIKDVKENGIKTPIEVEGIITTEGKRYKIIHGCHRAAAGLQIGITEFPAREIISRS